MIPPLLPTVPLDAIAGEPFDPTIPVLTAAGAPVPAAQIASAHAQVRATLDSSTVLVDFTTAGPSPTAVITDDGVMLTADAATTATWQTWPIRSPVWDLLVVDHGGRVSRITAPSPFRVHPGVTR